MTTWDGELLELLLGWGTVGFAQNYVYTFRPLENLHQESFSILYIFFHPPTYRKHRWQPRSARIYARVEVIFAKLVCRTVGGQFFLFCQN
jgi:hypothetical protein